MRRREFIAGLGGAAAWPLVARAQQPDRMRRIGVLSPYNENDPGAKAQLSAFMQGLRSWVGQTAAVCGWTFAGLPATLTG
jgi:putative ABC transport system substrate-binding protein